jgi:hypothetical protein
MKSTAKVWVLTGAAWTSVTLFMMGLYLFSFHRSLIQEIWRQSESITDKKPTNAYQVYTRQGFQILVDKDLLDKPDRTDLLLKKLDAALLKISQVVSPSQFAAMRQTKIWVSLPKHRLVNESSSEMSGHTSQAIALYRKSTAKELKSHGHNPDKAKSVEIFNAGLFTRAPADLQLVIVLHELAHAYHDKVLDARKPEIRSTYKKAMARGHYNIPDPRSETAGKAYAATNEYEYFAELSVAYLAKNDGFPQDRYVLAKADPIGYHLMQQVWGAPK